MRFIYIFLDRGHLPKASATLSFFDRKASVNTVNKQKISQLCSIWLCWNVRICLCSETSSVSSEFSSFSYIPVPHIHKNICIYIYKIGHRETDIFCVRQLCYWLKNNIQCGCGINNAFWKQKFCIYIYIYNIYFVCIIYISYFPGNVASMTASLSAIEIINVINAITSKITAWYVVNRNRSPSNKCNYQQNNGMECSQ